MSAAPYAWEPLFARAEAKVCSFDAAGLDDAIAQLTCNLERLFEQAPPARDELKALHERLESFVRQCEYVKQQLSLALTHAASQDDRLPRYSRVGGKASKRDAPVHAYLRRLA